MTRCPWCDSRPATYTALHAHFAQVHVGDPQSAHRRDPLVRNGIGGCRGAGFASQHGTIKAAPEALARSEGLTRTSRSTVKEVG